ncbi:glycine zipper domain-containing protein [Cupriavidus sp. EM10]
MGVLREDARQRTREFTKATDAYVHEHPWQCIGTVAMLSAAIGAISTLAGSRRH